MANVHWLKKPVAEQVQEFVADASLAIDIGDLMYHTGDDAKPASSQTDQGSEHLNQQEFAKNFIGVSQSARLSTQTTAGVVRVQTDGLYEFTCTSATFEIGDLVGADEASSGTALEDQSVKKVTAPHLAIGVVVKRYSSATTKVWCRLKGRVSSDIESANSDVQYRTADDSEVTTLNVISPKAKTVHVEGVTNDANDFVVLPSLAEVPDGHRITMIAGAGANFEVRTPATSAEEINSEDCDGTKEYLMTDTQIHEFIKIDDTIGWMGHGYSAIGAVVTAVVPD